MEFWRMTFQFKVEAIVMLTPLVEGKKIKCHDYFPKLNEQKIFGKISIFCNTEEKTATFERRILEVTKVEINHKS